MGGEHFGVALLEREDALSTLEAAFGAVVAGHGGVALVSGEAGIGKTSLVRAFVARERRATRVLAGACDDLAVPRPLGPFLDIARELPGLAVELGQGGVDAARLVLDALGGSGSTICIVEDAHWADEATIDVLTYVARRVESVPALLVVSFRDDEVGPDHPLRRALAATPAGRTHRLELERLSVEAVALLAGTEVDATALRAITGGNPLFVREALASGPGRTPASVRDAVLARAARLSDAARAVAELVSVFPARPSLPLLEESAESAESLHAGLSECERGGLLAVEHDLVGFRHELARWAVEESLAGPRRRDLNRRRPWRARPGPTSERPRGRGRRVPAARENAARPPSRLRPSSGQLRTRRPRQCRRARACVTRDNPPRRRRHRSARRAARSLPSPPLGRSFPLGLRWSVE